MKTNNQANHTCIKQGEDVNGGRGGWAGYVIILFYPTAGDDVHMYEFSLSVSHQITLA